MLLGGCQRRSANFRKPDTPFLRYHPIVLVAVYSASQLAKGAAPQEAVEFAVLWTAITLGIFHGARAYYRRTGQNCKVEKS